MKAKAREALAGILCLTLLACQARIVDDEGNTQAVGSAAPDVASPCLPVMFEQTPLTHCTADRERHAIRTVLGDDAGAPYRSFAAYAASRPADAPPVAFAMNGGMFDEEGEPVGYYVEDGERLKPINRNEGPGNFHMLPNGIFYGFAEGPWRVWETQRFWDNAEGRPDFATQSGPMLVLANELHPAFDENGESLKIRNGVGVDPSGRAHFVISEAPVSFGRFARYFRDVIGTPNALFLDGSVSQLWDPARGRMDGGAPIGPMIVVEMRANAQ